MKKLIIVCILLAAIVAVWLWPKEEVKQPILLSAQLDEALQTIEVSYIVDQRNDTYLTSIELEGYTYLATNERKTKVLAKQRGYELREDVIMLTNEQLDSLLSKDWRIPMATFSFEDYPPLTESLIVLLKNEAAQAEKVDNDKLVYTYVADKDMELTNIGHYDSASLISFTHNDEEIQFPLTLKKGDEVQVAINGPISLATNDKLLLELMLENDERITKHIATTNEMPKDYLEQMVELMNK
jgi:hypothetical protein